MDLFLYGNLVIMHQTFAIIMLSLKFVTTRGGQCLSTQVQKDIDFYLCAINLYVKTKIGLNFKSNIIFLVNGLGKIFAWPGATSSWMHGSLTTNGLFLDQRSNDLFAFATYQEMIKELKYGNQSVIHDLSNEER